MKKVLILGGTYFIGKAIVEALLSSQKDYEIYTLNRGSRKTEDNRITNILCDRENLSEMKKCLSEYEFNYIIDVSGLNIKQLEVLHEALNYEQLEKFVFISSSAVYDVENYKIPFKESAMLGENKYWSDYGTNKIECEEFLEDKYNYSNIQLILLRPPYVYGENNYAAREGFIFHHIINDRTILIPNDGETKIQFIYAEDLGNIAAGILETNQDNLSIYNVGNGGAVTFNTWIELCEKAAGKKAIKHHFYYEKNGYKERDFFPFFDYDNVLDVKKIHRIFKEETSMEEGLKNCYQWYLHNESMVVMKKHVAEKEEEIYKLLEK
ncbi:NAD-dependent epimerase/dehydratase family protein [Clostridium sp.]|uniref:NAD-dependent epimerase/dehydratase family protein n=1 Tax=Clostridium sp. TaxID=1506 RepID=UPI00321660A0